MASSIERSNDNDRSGISNYSSSSSSNNNSNSSSNSDSDSQNLASNSKAFRVVVPNGVSKGDTFKYEAGEEIGPLMIIVPDAAESGSVLEIKVVSNGPKKSSVLESSPSMSPDLISIEREDDEDNYKEEEEEEEEEASDNDADDHTTTATRLRVETAVRKLDIWRKEMIQNSRFSILRILAEVLVFLCLTLSYTLQPYANVSFSNRCNMRNVKDNSTITSLYFNMWRGLSTNAASCSNNAGNFCIRWTNNAFWNSFSDITRGNGRLYYRNGTRTAAFWIELQVLIPLASALIISCALLRLVMHFKVGNSRTTHLSVASLYAGAGLFKGASWKLSLIGFIANALGTSMSNFAWYSYIVTTFLQGAVEGNKYFTVDSNPSFCQVKIHYDIGGIFLIVALVLSMSLVVLNLAIWCRLNCGNISMSEKDVIKQQQDSESAPTLQNRQQQHQQEQHHMRRDSANKGHSVFASRGDRDRDSGICTYSPIDPLIQLTPSRQQKQRQMQRQILTMKPNNNTKVESSSFADFLRSHDEEDGDRK